MKGVVFMWKFGVSTSLTSNILSPEIKAKLRENGPDGSSSESLLSREAGGSEITLSQSVIQVGAETFSGTFKHYQNQYSKLEEVPYYCERNVKI